MPSPPATDDEGTIPSGDGLVTREQKLDVDRENAEDSAGDGDPAVEAGESDQTTEAGTAEPAGEDEPAEDSSVTDPSNADPGEVGPSNTMPGGANKPDVEAQPDAKQPPAKTPAKQPTEQPAAAPVTDAPGTATADTSDTAAAAAGSGSTPAEGGPTAPPLPKRPVSPRPFPPFPGPIQSDAPEPVSGRLHTGPTAPAQGRPQQGRPQQDRPQQDRPQQRRSTQQGPVRTAPMRGPQNRTMPAETVPGEAVPAEAVLIEDHDQDEDSGERRRISRRALLQAALIGGAGIAALPLLALISNLTKPKPPAGISYPLNADWLFGGYQPGAESTGYDDTGFAPVTVPHNVAEMSWRNWNPASWQKTWLYRRHFEGAPLISHTKPGNRVFVDFDGVMVSATVVCNNQVVATHQGGYLPFSAEITNQLTAGRNVLSVIVDSRCLPVPPIPVGSGPAIVDFLQPGGIYRDVSLRVVPQVFISDMFALPMDVLTDQRRIDVQCTIDAARKPELPVTLRLDLLDGTQAIASTTGTVTIDKPGPSVTSLSLTDLGQIKLWSTGSPKLYTVQATLTVPHVGTHVTTRRIGFRDIKFQPDGFHLNGQRLQLFGLDRHQLFPYMGMAMPARVQRQDAEILRNQFNCNMVRCSHYPQSPHFLDACDELGLLVWEEAPGWDHVSTQPSWQNQVVQNVRDMVTRDRNHPSVIVWGTRLNETTDYPHLWAATRQAARELDPSRPSSGAMDIYDTAQWAEDVFGFNDYTYNRRTGAAGLMPPLAGVPYLVTEAVGVVEARPEHFAWTDSPQLLAKQAALHAQAHNVARSDPHYSGLLAWSAFDYCSLQGHPGSIKWTGVADGFRVPKPGAAIYQTQVDPAVRPMIVPVFFWQSSGPQPDPGPKTSSKAGPKSSPGAGTQPRPLTGPPAGPGMMIASNCEMLHVSINGSQVMAALPATSSPQYRNLPYPPFLVSLPAVETPGPAELLIEGFVGGQRVAEVRMTTDPASDHLVMAADDASIAADGSDATRVVFRGVDAYGNLRRIFSGEVTLTLEGPGGLIGDNPFQFGAYGGLGAVWVRSVSGRLGTITVTAMHPTLGRAQVRIASVRPDTPPTPV
ncbi:MAG TPA: glycoside hydrolase family 2 TIM barrel-domain containing protein [Streptosporangiaceae bacterium]